MGFSIRGSQMQGGSHLGTPNAGELHLGTPNGSLRREICILQNALKRTEARMKLHFAKYPQMGILQNAPKWTETRLKFHFAKCPRITKHHILHSQMVPTIWAKPAQTSFYIPKWSSGLIVHPQNNACKTGFRGVQFGF